VLLPALLRHEYTMCDDDLCGLTQILELHPHGRFWLVLCIFPGPGVLEQASASWCYIYVSSRLIAA